MTAVAQKSKPAAAAKKAAKLPPPLKASEPEVTILAEQQVPVGLLWFDGQNDRLEELLDPALIDPLAGTIARFGLQHPIQVTKLGAPEGKWRVVLGHRRVLAIKRLDRAQVAAHVAEYGSEAQIAEARAVENMQREQPHFMEEAISIARMLDGQAVQILQSPDARYDALHKTEKTAAVAAVSERLGKGEQWVRDRAFLARLDGKSRELVLSGKLPLAQAREISKLADPRARDQLAQDAAGGGRSYAHGYGKGEPMSLEEVREEVSKSLFSLAQVPWRLDVPFSGAPSCSSCPANSANNPGLFDHDTRFSQNRDEARRSHGGSGKKEPASGVCQNPSCYGRKNQAAGQALGHAATAVAREVRQADKPKRPKAKREALARLVPKFVERDAVAHKVDQRLAPKKAAGKSSPGAYKPAPVNPVVQAERKWRDAMRERCRKVIEPAIKRFFPMNPGLWALFTLFKETTIFRATQSHNDGSARRAVESAELNAALKIMMARDWEAVLKIEKMCGRKETFFEDWYDGPSGMADKVAAALGVKLPPPPKLEEFLPKAMQPKGDARGASSPAGKPSAGSSKSSGSAPTADAEDDGGDE